MDCFDVEMNGGRLAVMSSLALAHVGDAVFELMVRTMLAKKGAETAPLLHKKTIALVSAKAQAARAERILPHLTEKESAVFKRGRNAKVSGHSRPSSEGEYHTATALEALFGWLYLQGDKERLNTLFSIMMEEENAP